MQMRWFLGRYCYWAAQKTEKHAEAKTTGSEVYQIEQECIMYTIHILTPPEKYPLPLLMLREYCSGTIQNYQNKEI